MNRTITSAAFALAILAGTTGAHAQSTPAPDATIVAPSKARIAGINLTLAPIGQATSGRDSADLETSFGVRPYFDFAVSPNLSIGLAPQLLFNVKTQGDVTSARQFDVMARATVRLAKTGRVTPIGYAAAGWSMLRLPTWAHSHPSGFGFGVGGGINYDLSPTGFFSAELGYQQSAMEAYIQGDQLAIGTSYVHIAFGVGTYL